MSEYKSVKVRRKFHEQLRIEAAKFKKGNHRGMTIMDYLEYIHREFKTKHYAKKTSNDS